MNFDDVLNRIIALSEPFWNVRSNAIHVPESYRCAKDLLTCYPGADREVVLPAILMHDNGYANVPPETLLKGLADAPTGYNPDITRLHEIEGAKIARQILQSIDFDTARTEIICQIIDGHDSRLEAISLEDKLVKDADKLWRFTESGIRIGGNEWMNMETNPFIDYLLAGVDKWMFTDEARTMARQFAQEARQWAS